MNTEDLFAQRIENSLAAIASLRNRLTELSAIADVIIRTLESGGTLYTAGNGGSAAEAMHLAEELIGRYRANRRPLRAICLNADPTVLTCVANDFGYESVFARQCEALLTPRDALVVLTTSGNSPNITAAVKAAKLAGAATIGLLGRDGGACKQYCDHMIIVGPAGGDGSMDSAHIQEAHQVIVHLICEAAERRFGCAR